MEIGITQTNVNKFFGDKQVLKDVNISIPRGQIYGLLGPSGCGKTTTVKIMAGITESTSGETTVLGEKMPSLEIMKKIGYMAQSDALYTALPAKDNLDFFGTLYGLKKEELALRIEEVMNLVNLNDHIDKLTGAYSGGMKRRLSLAIALLHAPTILILDEPTVGIDPILRKNVWDEFGNLARLGTSVLVTTHVMDEAEKCDILTMMRDGEVIATGTPKELQENIGATSIEEAFIHYGSDKDANLAF